MIPQQPIEAIRTYGTQTQYITPPTTEDIDKGVEPLDSLPADWWNWLWNQITLEEGHTVQFCNSLFAEISTVLTAAGITPKEVNANDLLNAILTLTRAIATTEVAGSIKSSLVSGRIVVNTDGTAGVNDLGDPTKLATTSKQIVGAVNELNDILTNFIVTTAKIADGAVTTAKLETQTVTTDKIAGNAITEDRLANEAVTSVKIADGAVTATKCAGDVVKSVNGNKPTNGNVTISLPSVDYPISVAKGGTGVTSQAEINKAIIGNLSLGEDIVSDGTEFVSSVVAGDGFNTASNRNIPYKRKFSKVWEYIKAKILAMTDWVTRDAIADGAVTNTKLARNAVATANLLAGAVTQEKIANGSVTSEELADGAVKRANLALGAVALYVYTMALSASGTICYFHLHLGARITNISQLCAAHSGVSVPATGYIESKRIACKVDISAQNVVVWGFTSTYAYSSSTYGISQLAILSIKEVSTPT